MHAAEQADMYVHLNHAAPNGATVELMTIIAEVAAKLLSETAVAACIHRPHSHQRCRLRSHL
jgi:hypothetical protein